MEAPAPEFPPDVLPKPGHSLARRLLDRALPGELHLQLLWLLLGVSLMLRLLWLAQPPGALIFDEKYYINSARVLLSIPPGDGVYEDRPPGLDPNTEHPPLVKLLVAGSMLVLGDNAFGWRLPSVLFGTAGILLMYGVARRVGAEPYAALLAAALLSFDNLAFAHSRIFTLDIFQLTFLLAGIYGYVGGRPAVGGAGLALAALSKSNGMFGLAVLAGFEALRFFHERASWRARWRPALGRLLRTGAAFAAVFLLLLWGMDHFWTGYTNPFEHVQHIISYGTALRRDNGPSGIESFPWQWLWNQEQIPYLRVDQHIKVGEEVRETRPLVLFLGAMNPFILHLFPLGLAFAAHVWRRREAEADWGALALAWFFFTYAPFFLTTVLFHRISYLYYFLPTLPAVALANSLFLTRARLPRLVLWVYLAAVLLGFYGYFPFKSIP
ncbi:MAG: glycosyltransferase family 39 protein [Chloroflexi bacterium]|nr:glycosyltransferase family 39 protein [Chloroflexota bacterium]